MENFCTTGRKNDEKWLKTMIKNDKTWQKNDQKNEDDKINDKKKMNAMITKMIKKWKINILKISNV